MCEGQWGRKEGWWGEVEARYVSIMAPVSKWWHPLLPFYPTPEGSVFLLKIPFLIINRGFSWSWSKCTVYGLSSSLKLYLWWRAILRLDFFRAVRRCWWCWGVWVDVTSSGTHIKSFRIHKPTTINSQDIHCILQLKHILFSRVFHFVWQSELNQQQKSYLFVGWNFTITQTIPPCLPPLLQKKTIWFAFELRMSIWTQLTIL